LNQHIKNKELNWIELWLYRPLLDPGRFFQFLDPIQIREDSLDGGSARLKLANYILDNNKKRINTHRDVHASRGIQTHDPSVSAGEGSHALQNKATVIGN
jgi:hypothetical protein